MLVSSCDLLYLISQAPYKKIPNVTVIGMITGVVPLVDGTYESTKVDSKTNIYTLDIFAVKFNGSDLCAKMTGMYNERHTYFCNGTLAVSADASASKHLVGDLWEFRGRLSQPKDCLNVVNMFEFRKSDSGWVISNVMYDDVDASVLDETFLNYLLLSSKMNCIQQPASVSKTPRVTPYRERQSNEPDFNVKSKVEVEEPSYDMSETISNIKNSEIVEKPEEPVVSKPEEISQPKEAESNPSSFQNVLKVSLDSKFAKSKIKSLTFKGTRDQLLGYSPNYNKLDNLCDNLNTRQDAYLAEFGKRYPTTSQANSHIEFMLSHLINYWNSKPSGLTRTGRDIVGNYINRSDVNTSESYLGVTVEKYLMSLGSSLLQYTLGITELDCTDEALEAGMTLFSNAETTYAGLLAVVVGLSVPNMVSLASRCYNLGISFSALINGNPYSLVLIGNYLSFKDIEKLAVCLGKANKKNIQRGKNVALLFNHMMTCNGGDTIYNKNDLLRAKLGSQHTQREHTAVIGHQPTIQRGIRDELKAYVNDSLTLEDWLFSPVGWVKNGFSYVLPLPPAELDIAVSDLTLSGIGTEIKIGRDSWICSTVHLKKELFIYDKAYTLGKKRMHYSLDDIEKYIREFEDMKGFKLEERQVEAVKLCMWGMAVITGGAGSGKTTISECIVYVLRKLKPNIKIAFGAPTGKASKRLQEVTGEQAYTMHSMFGVHCGAKDLFEEQDEDDDSSHEYDVYILDENAMSTLDLLYNVLKKITKAQVFLLGDIDQLPPIGKGLPFRTFLQFLPYVALNVSKRSAEGSKITKNSDIIRSHSTDDNWQDLESDGNCRLLECADDNIADIINDLCRWHLGVSKVRPEGAVDMKFNADDIQVVSPVKSEKYTWGTGKLNPLLQNTFCPMQYGMSFVYSKSETVNVSYRIGDRIIHTSNDYSMVHYNTWKNGMCEMSERALGIMNGDVGTIVGVLPSTTTTIRRTDLDPSISREPRNDKSWYGEKKYFIVAEFYDYEAGCNYYILYRAVLSQASTEIEKVFVGGDLSNFELAYALTTHKMQGSQSKLIIVAVGHMANKGFLNRNMIYTSLTRGEALVYLVGNVSNDRSSALSVARTLLASNNTITIADVALLN